LTSNPELENSRECRRRKKDGLRQVRCEVFEAELDALARHGLLPESGRHDAWEIARAVERVVERTVKELTKGNGQC
jgi:hypothetical protein